MPGHELWQLRDRHTACPDTNTVKIARLPVKQKVISEKGIIFL